MKKLVSRLLTVCMCLSVGIMLMACVGCEQKKDEPVDTTVTEEEWILAFTGTNEGIAKFTGVKNVTIEELVKLYSTDATEPDMVACQLSKFTESSACLTISDKDNTLIDEKYLALKDDYVYLLQKENDTWFGSKKQSHEYSSFRSFFFQRALDFIDQYQTFTYNNETGCYIAYNFPVDSDTDEEYDILKIYFENGKLVKLEAEITTETERIVGSYTFSNYGTTTIDVPEWTEATE